MTITKALAYSLFIAAIGLTAQAKSFLRTNEHLRTNEYLVSDNQGFYAILQSDGNLCVYRGSGPDRNLGTVWCSGRTAGGGQFWAVQQGDGNICVYAGSGPGDYRGGVWCSMATGGGGSFFTVLQADGNFVTYRGSDPGNNLGFHWQSAKTATPAPPPPPPPSSANGSVYMATNQYLRTNEYLVSSNRAFFAVLQSDGNLCVNKGSGPSENFGALWCTMQAPGNGQYYVLMQTDGNLCVYKGSPGAPAGTVWCSMVTREYPTFTVVQDDGNFAVYRGPNPGDNRGYMWASGKTSAITWASGGKYLHNPHYSVNWVSGDPAGLDATMIWMGHAQYYAARRFVFWNDSTLRPADETTACVSFHPTTMRMVLERGWKETDLTLSSCNGSSDQKGWRFAGGKILKDTHPHGCMVGKHQNTWVWPQFAFSCPTNWGGAQWTLNP